MTATAQSVLQSVLQLDAEDRDELIAELNATQEVSGKMLYEEEWIAECQRRMADLKAGITKAVPSEEVYRQLRERVVAIQ